LTKDRYFTCNYLPYSRRQTCKPHSAQRVIASVSG